MLAFSCAHCGKRMTLSEQDGGKRAECSSCGHSLDIPGGRKRSRADRVETLTATPVHELPTRIDPGPVGQARLTAMLWPPRGPGEIGRFGGYIIKEVIGAGGMGVVFRAEDPQLLREVALKAMLPALAANETARERFLREARAAAAIQHDRVVAIYTVGEDNGVPFLAMPFLRGESLEQRLRRGALPVSEVARIGAEIAEGLEAIHERGLIHRDIKPANVWLEGAAGRVKVLDFGLARAAGASTLTRDGLVGSPAFMSPEQARRETVDARSDLFALGVVLYSMAAGALPFDGDDALAVLLAITAAEPPPLPETVTPGLSRLVLRLLAKRPADRPASAGEVRAELERLR